MENVLQSFALTNFFLEIKTWFEFTMKMSQKVIYPLIQLSKNSQRN